MENRPAGTTDLELRLRTGLPFWSAGLGRNSVRSCGYFVALCMARQDCAADDSNRPFVVIAGQLVEDMRDSSRRKRMQRQVRRAEEAKEKKKETNAVPDRILPPYRLPVAQIMWAALTSRWAPPQSSPEVAPLVFISLNSSPMSSLFSQPIVPTI